MSDAFEEIQAIKIKRNSYREKLQKRKRERHELYTLTSTPVPSTLTTESACPGIEKNFNITNYQLHYKFDEEEFIRDFNV